jgi:hypothetical protein
MLPGCLSAHLQRVASSARRDVKQLEFTTVALPFRRVVIGVLVLSAMMVMARAVVS